MTVITSGRISMSPVTIKTALSLDALRGSMNSQRYSGSVPSSGWGGLHDEDDFLGVLTGRPNPGYPEQYEPDDLHPRLVAVRYYYDAYDKRAVEYASLTTIDQPQYRLAAADVLVRESSQPGELLGFVSVGVSASGYRSVLAGIEEQIQISDPNAKVYKGSDDVSFGDDDFFRWLLAKAVEGGTITEDLSVSIVRDMAGQDPLSRSSSVSQGASLDRPELLSMLARSKSTFGPAKFASYFAPLGIHLDLDLRQDGSFLLQTGNSWYDEAPPPSEERIRLVIDAATTVIPALRTAYYADRKWPRKNRTAFIERAIKELKDVVDELVKSLEK